METFQIWKGRNCVHSAQIHGYPTWEYEERIIHSRRGGSTEDDEYSDDGPAQSSPETDHILYPRDAHAITGDVAIFKRPLETSTPLKPDPKKRFPENQGWGTRCENRLPGFGRFEPVGLFP